MIFNTIEIEDATEICPDELEQLLKIINFNGSIKSDKKAIITAIDNFFIMKMKRDTLSGGFKSLLKGIVETKNLTFDEMIDLIIQNENKITYK